MSARRADFPGGIHGDAHQVAAFAGIGERFGKDTGSGGGVEIGRALPAEQGGPDQEKKSDERRNRIAGKTEEKFFPAAAKNKRTAGTDGDFPELQFAAELLEGGFDEIHFTNGHAAGGDDEVALSEGGFQRGAGVRQSVFDEGENPGFRAGAAAKSGEAEAVALEYFSGQQRSSSFDQFRTGGEQAADRASSDVEVRQADGGEQVDTAGGEVIANLAEGCAAFEILALKADAFPGFAGIEEPDGTGPGGVGAGVFLHHHGIGAGWEGRAGEHPDATAGGDPAGKYFPGGGAAKQLE